MSAQKLHWCYSVNSADEQSQIKERRNMSVTVYSKPRCVQCDATKRALKKQGISYAEIDMSQDLDALEQVKS